MPLLRDPEPRGRRVVLVTTAPDHAPGRYRARARAIGVKAPLGLVLLATALKIEDFSVRIIDGHLCDADAELRRELAAGDLLCVGFSVMSSQYRTSAALSRLVREERPGLPVVWGGFHPTIFPQRTLSSGVCDFVFRGEADRAFVEFCRRLRTAAGLDDVPNLVRRDGTGIVSAASAPLSGFDALPELDWSVLDDLEAHVVKEDDLGRRTRRMNVLAGLGCNHRCAFCHNAIFHKRHRTRGAAALVAEMSRLHDSLGVEEFWLDDEDFFQDRPRLEEFLDLLERNPRRFRWDANLRASYVRPTYVNPALLRRMAAVGCHVLAVGAESGSEIVLRRLCKGIQVEDVVRMAEYARGVAVHVMWLFMVGVPGETCAMTLQTLRLIEKLRRIKPESTVAGPQVYRPFPGSPLYQEALAMGLEEPEDWEDADAFLKTLVHLQRIEPREIPWVAEPRRFQYMMLSYYLLILRRQGALRRLLLPILGLWSRVRLRTGFYSWWIEKPLLDIVNARLT